MIKVKNSKLIDMYIQKYGIKDIFTDDIRSLMELAYYKKNEYICRENESINYLFLFLEGKAKVYSTLSNGKSLLLCFYQDFKLLGELEVIDGGVASATVQVIEDTCCICISSENVRKYLINDAKFLRYICSSLGQKVDRNSKNSSINLLYPLENRLASYILVTGEKANCNDKELIRFNENLTQTSELLGTSYRHLLRTLGILCSKGIITKKDDYYEVVDEESLRGLAADLYR